MRLCELGGCDFSSQTIADLYVQECFQREGTFELLGLSSCLIDFDGSIFARLDYVEQCRWDLYRSETECSVEEKNNQSKSINI